MGIRRGIGQFRRRITAFVACRFPPPAASLSSPHYHRPSTPIPAFSFGTRHVFPCCAFSLLLLLMWTSFGLPGFPAVLLWFIHLTFVLHALSSNSPRLAR